MSDSALDIRVHGCGYGCPFAAIGDMDGWWCALAFCLYGGHMDIKPSGPPPAKCPLRIAATVVRLGEEAE